MKNKPVIDSCIISIHWCIEFMILIKYLISLPVKELAYAEKLPTLEARLVNLCEVLLPDKTDNRTDLKKSLNSKETSKGYKN